MGFDPADLKTRLGNLLALRAVALLYIAHRLFVPGLAGLNRRSCP